MPTSARSGHPPSRASGHLRPEPSRFLGRAGELRRLAESMAARRIVTLVGLAGIGKTRLALRHAIERRDDYRTVWYVEAGEARDADDLVAIVLRLLGRDPAGQTSEHAALACGRAIAARAGSLFVIDNVEHLLPRAAAVIARWLVAAPDVRFLVTSRVPVGIDAEEVIELGPLAVPAPGQATGDAVELFVDRVRGQHGDYAPAPEELARIAEVVRGFAGVPLAIELLAARAGDGDAGHVGERITEIIEAGPISGDGRGTPRAIGRAFSMLGPVAQETLGQCTVFRGAFGTEAAERVVRLGPGAPPIEECLVALARAGLLFVEQYNPLRFSMSESVRTYAAQALAASPEAAAAEWRHAQYHFERAVTIADAEPAAWPAGAAKDRDELQAVMEFGARARQPALVLRAALALDALSMGAGLGARQLALLDDALRAGAAGDLRLVGRALGVRAGALYALGRLVEARHDAGTALRLATEVDDRRQMAAMHRSVGLANLQLGELAAAEEHLAAALALEEARGDAASQASVHYYLGSLYQSRDEAPRAHAAFHRALALARATGSSAVRMRAVMGLAWHHMERGAHEEARAHFALATSIAERLGVERTVRIGTGYLGLLEFDAGNLEVAEAHLRDAVVASRRAGDVHNEGIFEGVRGGVLAALDRAAEARAAFAVATHLLSGNGFYAAAVAVHRGHLELAEARAAAAAGDALEAEARRADARERIAAATRADAGGPSLVDRSDDARLAVRILARAISPS